MAKNEGAGCGGLILLGFIIFAIGRCSGGAEDKATASLIDGYAPAASDRQRTLYHRYVQPSSLNCRVSPSTRAERVESIGRASYVGIIETRDGWSFLDRPTDCWVSNSHLASSPPPAEIRPLYSGGGSGGGQRSNASSTRRRGGAFANCSAARAAGAAPVYAGDPGYGRHLDRDGDGIGCE